MPISYHKEVLHAVEISGELGQRLAAARERSGFSQEDIALLLTQPRPVVSNWESGRWRPNTLQLTKLAAIYRTPLEELLGLKDDSRPETERLLFRDASDRLNAQGKYQVQRFLGFLDSYSEFLVALDEPPGLSTAPLSIRAGHTSKEDIRRKAEDARALLRIGSGPVGDLTSLADLNGITVYFAPLGSDLKRTVSGAFVPHDRVGFSILVNAETTPGRRQFTLAHELAHALFHGDHPYVQYAGRREGYERFANAFAAEFLVPTDTLLSAAEALGVRKIDDPEPVVHLQRLFRVSYGMILVRLRAAGLLSAENAQRLSEIRPVHLAERLGYSIEPDEWGQDPDRWGLARYPRRFLRLLRGAIESALATVSGAASLTGLAEEDIEEFLADPPSSPEDSDEFDYFAASA